MKWDNSYNINFKKLALLLLPTMFRKDMLGEIAKILVNPVNYVHSALMDFRRKKDFRLTHNGQRCYLRGCLNELYDPLSRRIEISEAEERSATLIFERDDSQNRVALIQPEQPLMLNARGFLGNGLDFTVKVPEDVLTTYTENVIKATVSEYKLASKQFKIITL
ncbi:MAG: hypothetical protein LBR52_04695 [Prevotellaceae bacterium]|jgi:hypothetical protein|nr:hypothetical protein [Prevotellaceae bacterium]